MLPPEVQRLGGPKPTLQGRGALQPLGGPGLSRAGSGLSALRQPTSTPLATSRSQKPVAFGLAAETELKTEAVNPLPRLGSLGDASTARPARQPAAPPAYGLASEVELRPALVPQRQPALLPAPSLQLQQREGYGLEQDVDDAASAGALPPTPLQQQQADGYGLYDEIQATGLPPPLPPPPQFGLEQEVAAAGPLPITAVPGGFGGQSYLAPPPGGNAEGYGLESDIQQAQQLMQVLISKGARIPKFSFGM